MSALDTMSGIAVGGFLLMVAVKGNSSALVAQAEADKSFLKWGAAVAILYYLRGIPDITGIMDMLIVAAFIGLAIEAGPNIKQNAQSFWQSL